MTVVNSYKNRAACFRHLTHDVYKAANQIRPASRKSVSELSDFEETSAKYSSSPAGNLYDFCWPYLLVTLRLEFERFSCNEGPIPCSCSRFRLGIRPETQNRCFQSSERLASVQELIILKRFPWTRTEHLSPDLRHVSFCAMKPQRWGGGCKERLFLCIPAPALQMQEHRGSVLLLHLPFISLNKFWL